MEEYNQFQEEVTQDLKDYVIYQYDKEQEEYTQHLNNLSKVKIYRETIQEDGDCVFKIDLISNNSSYLQISTEIKNRYNDLLEYIDYLLS